MKYILIIILALLMGVGAFFAYNASVMPAKIYTAKDFNMKTIKSRKDFNKNGVDDYTDILLGARKDGENKPVYDGSYYVGGYPPDNIGVCTDVVWRAFKNAGYSLKDMVAQDIRKNTALYPNVNGKPDPNIDFRRVTNLKVYFERYAISLTLDTDRIDKWQPGDIVTYGTYHVAVVSDKRNSQGVPYIIHNAGQPVREEDTLASPDISGHFRFDASKCKKSDLIQFADR